jgi:hypothetical protein
LEQNLRLPFSDGAFSRIVMADVIWCILPVVGNVFKEFGRLLSDNGHLVVKQSLLSPGKQQYGTEIVSEPKDVYQMVESAGIAVHRRILLSEPDGE